MKAASVDPNSWVDSSEPVSDAAELVLREARRRQRRRKGLIGLAVVLTLAVAMAAANLRSGGRVPPAGGSHLHQTSSGIRVPAGATLESKRTIKGWELRVYASPNPLTSGRDPLDKVHFFYQFVEPNGLVFESVNGDTGFAQGSGVVFESGNTGNPSAMHDWTINNFVVTDPTITKTQLVIGGKVVDTMSPITYDGIRFVFLAYEGPPPVDAHVSGLDNSGDIVATGPYSPPLPAA